jgi:hypothetical protein
MMDSQGIRIDCRKGDPAKLRGKLIAYVRIEGQGNGEGRAYSSGEGEGYSGDRGESPSPLGAMVRNGILAVQANFVNQRTIRDFFREEFGISLEKGIQEVIEQARDTGGLEGALDPEAVKERLESMKNADFIPIPAKIAFFSSEEEMLAGDADVYYLGSFTVLSHAHLCVNSFPIIYQAYFREQEHRSVESEIAALLGSIEDPRRKEAEPTIQNYTGDLKAYMLKDLIPRLIYSLGDKAEYAKALGQFKSFMVDFGYPGDVQEILTLIESTPSHDARNLRKLELLVAKIEALQKEDYEALESIRNQLKGL